MDILDFIPRYEEKAIHWNLYSEGWIPSALQPQLLRLRLHAPRQSRALLLPTVGMVHENTGLESPVLELALWLLSTP